MNVCEHCLGTGVVLDRAGHHLVKCPRCGGERAIAAADSAQELQRFRDWTALVRVRDAEEEHRLERKAR